MRTRSRCFSLAAVSCVLALSAGCDVGLPSAPATPLFSHAGGPKLVPFHLTVTSGSSTAAPDGRCGAFPNLTLDIVGTAVSTHLGNTAVSQSHCFNAFDPSSFTDGEFTDTAADGSTITGTYHGVLLPSSDPLIMLIQGEWTITGGTRRFAGATGSGEATGTVHVVTNALTLELHGTITSIGSAKH